MRRLGAAFGLTLGVGLLIHCGAIWATPRIVMARVLSVAARQAGINRFAHPPLATADYQPIVRSCPDLAYSFCVLDLAEGPVRIRVPLSAPYTSVALYSSATDNYFARNDRDAGGRAFDLVVYAPGVAPPGEVPLGAELVQAPEKRSFVLVRRVVQDAGSFLAIDALRKTAVCALHR